MQELEDILKNIQLQNSELTSENSKLQLALDEMRAVYRNKLISLANEANKIVGKFHQIKIR